MFFSFYHIFWLKTWKYINLNANGPYYTEKYWSWYNVENVEYMYNKVDRLNSCIQCPNLIILSRVSNPPKPVSIERQLKSWKIEYNFKWNQPYLIRGSNSLNSASGLLKCQNWLISVLNYSVTIMKNAKLNAETKIQA